MTYEFNKMNAKLARKIKYRGPKVQDYNESMLRQRVGAKVLRIDVIDENNDSNGLETIEVNDKKTN